MLSIIYPYRDRDVQRVKKSLESLVHQTNRNFEVYFVNYGSTNTFTKQIEDLIQNYSFIHYSYLYTMFQPWNKSKALNSALKIIDSDYFFVADIDMIFSPNFVEKALNLVKNNEVWYFQVGFLSKEESIKNKDFKDYSVKFKSNREATGLTLCSIEAARSIGGFDEFYHFWGSEDTDFHIRLINSGYKVNFYDKTVMLLHQWHETYRNKEVKSLSNSLQISGVVQFNAYYLKKAIDENRSKIHNVKCGWTQTKIDFKELQEGAESKRVSNNKDEIEYFLFQELPNLKPGIYAYEFYEIQKNKSFKSLIKHTIKNKKERYYNLKNINDMLLTHIINFYCYCPYNYIVSNDLKAIKFVIIKQ